MNFIETLKRFRFFQYSYKEPAEFYSHQIKVPNLVSKFSGMDVFSANYKIPNVCVIMSIIYMTVYFCINTTSAYELRHSTEDLINCWITIGIAIQGASKIITFAIFRKKLVWLHQYTEMLYREECNSRTRVLLSKNVFLLSVILKAMLVCYAFTSFSLDFAPLLILAFTGEKMLPFGFHVPFIDRFSLSGYTINYLVQIVLTVFVSSCDMGPDCIYMLLSMNSFTQIDLIMESLKELSRRIEANDIEVDTCFEHIIKRHQEHLQ
ncbi:uncharacterized protein LOC135701670 [Ochlerotatus camptorhynchus]|uniref:uncharacterized protein LOC135701670 n=1 Tax=Ochlerotatus camptorhynchus TaxID=644619 RepID=UPI0031D11E03